jgi:hypothetical protein
MLQPSLSHVLRDKSETTKYDRQRGAATTSGSVELRGSGSVSLLDKDARWISRLCEMNRRIWEMKGGWTAWSLLFS